MKKRKTANQFYERKLILLPFYLSAAFEFLNNANGGEVILQFNYEQ